MKKRDVEASPERTPDSVPIICEAGASRSNNNLPIGAMREIRPISGARRSDKYCAAIVNGQSLMDDGIFDGDCAIVRLTFDQYELTPGRLVAVLTPYGLLIKHAYLCINEHIRLVSANPSFEDILLESGEVAVQGIVVRIERDL